MYDDCVTNSEAPIKNIIQPVDVSKQKIRFKYIRF